MISLTVKRLLTVKLPKHQREKQNKKLQVNDKNKNLQLRAGENVTILILGSDSQDGEN